jgi:hypothetical protein
MRVNEDHHESKVDGRRLTERHHNHPTQWVVGWTPIDPVGTRQYHFLDR